MGHRLRHRGQHPAANCRGDDRFRQGFPCRGSGRSCACLVKNGFHSRRRRCEVFAADLGAVLDSVQDVDASQIAAGVAVDETQLDKLVASVAKVASNYGIRFPREFALLVKQVLYFDRYTRLLAPGLDVLNDDRLSMNRPDVTVQSAGQPSTVVEVEVLPPE